MSCVELSPGFAISTSTILQVRKFPYEGYISKSDNKWHVGQPTHQEDRLLIKIRVDVRYRTDYDKIVVFSKKFTDLTVANDYYNAFLIKNTT